jgi:hypothetical protein
MADQRRVVPVSKSCRVSGHLKLLIIGLYAPFSISYADNRYIAIIYLYQAIAWLFL